MRTISGSKAKVKKYSKKFHTKILRKESIPILSELTTVEKEET